MPLAATDDPWAAYGRTVVDITGPDEGTLRVCAAPESDEAGWPWPDWRRVHILTAWDPGPARPGPQINRIRQASLEADLRSLGLPLFAAAGVDPVTGRREEGVAVGDARETDVLELGSRYGQDAVFAWTPQEWAVVACQGGRRLTTGWSLVHLPMGISLQPGG